MSLTGTPVRVGFAPVSYEIFVSGEIEFLSVRARTAWMEEVVLPETFADWNERFEGAPRSGRRVADVLADGEDSVSSDGSIGYFLDVVPDGCFVTVRGIVHRDGFDRELLTAFRCAGALDAAGEVLFERSTDGETYGLRLDGEETSYARASGIDSSTWTEIMVESQRRAAAASASR